MAAAMHLAMVAATERHRELIADLSAKRRRLCKSEMMRVRRTSTTDETRLLSN